MGDPNLYRVTLTADLQGNASDRIATVFGIRTLEFEPNPGIEPMSSGAGDQRAVAPESRPASAAGLTINNRFMCRINGKLISLRGAAVLVLTITSTDTTDARMPGSLKRPRQ